LIERMTAIPLGILYSLEDVDFIVAAIRSVWSLV